MKIYPRRRLNIAPEIRFPSDALSEELKDKLKKQLHLSLASGRREEKRLFYNVDAQLPYQVAVTSLGALPKSDYEKKEAFRRAVLGSNSSSGSKAR